MKNGAIYSEIVIRENGIPQGLFLSVLLFLVTINDIIKFVDFPVQSIGFAYDKLFLSRVENVDLIQENLTKIFVKPGMGGR